MAFCDILTEAEGVVVDFTRRHATSTACGYIQVIENGKARRLKFPSYTIDNKSAELLHPRVNCKVRVWYSGNQAMRVIILGLPEAFYWSTNKGSAHDNSKAPSIQASHSSDNNIAPSTTEPAPAVRASLDTVLAPLDIVVATPVSVPPCPATTTQDIITDSQSRPQKQHQSAHCQPCAVSPRATSR